MVKVNFEIKGLDKLKKTINNMQSGFSDFRKPLLESDGVLSEQIAESYKTEGSNVGGWDDLKPATKQQKARDGFGSKPTLTRTGGMRQAKKRNITATSLEIENTKPYFKYHQQGTKNIPQRKIYTITPQSEGKITKIFNEHIEDVIKKST